MLRLNNADNEECKLLFKESQRNYFKLTQPPFFLVPLDLRAYLSWVNNNKIKKPKHVMLSGALSRVKNRDENLFVKSDKTILIISTFVSF